MSSASMTSAVDLASLPRPQTLREASQRITSIKRELSRRKLDLHTDLPAKFKPLLQPSRYKGTHGGRGGAKSHVFAELLIARCNKRRTRAVCVREFQVSLEQSVKRLLEDKINYFGLTSRFKVFNNYIETPDDGIIIFQGMQSHTASSIKSLEGYDIAWVEEAQSLSQRSLDLLRPTIRKETCRFCRREGPMDKLVGVPCNPARKHLLDPSELWFSWNPSQATDPVDQLLRGAVLPPDAIVIETSYRDNPYFPDVLRKEMEWDMRDPTKFEHVWGGGYETHSEARVFKNWAVKEFETPENTAFYYGADWGFSVDPSTLVRCFVSADNTTLFIDHEAYGVGVEIDDIGKLFDHVPECRHAEIIADSARPETISYLRRNGFPNIVAAVKGPDSVKDGLKFLQNFDIVVHPRCVNTRKELTNYKYKTDAKTGTILLPAVPADKENHIIDPLRYATERIRKATLSCVW